MVCEEAIKEEVVVDVSKSTDMLAIQDPSRRPAQVNTRHSHPDEVIDALRGKVRGDTPLSCSLAQELHVDVQGCANVEHHNERQRRGPCDLLHFITGLEREVLLEDRVQQSTAFA